ncbi:MAG: Ig-like domain-containing protein [Alphaproteobacteria bacterium]|nr:Ig-like domain-containing protein [Alphaproteobacteria bacterium]
MKTLLATLALSTATPAWACGQSTHVWIGIEAVQYLPDGPLKALLQEDDLLVYRINGAMFPDGGYSPLTQDDYGEQAHWEPFQTAYLDWIKDTWDPPYTDPEARQHIAFLMGLAAHGMADQMFDGIYLTRSLLTYDGEARWDASVSGADTATDVALCIRQGRQPLVEDVVPYDTMVEVFDRYGQPTGRDVMMRGQASLRLAITYIGNLSEDPEESAAYDAEFPWANGHIDDPDVPGSPKEMQVGLAGYWTTLWDRLNDDFDPTAEAIFQTWPADGSYDHPTDALSIEAQVSVGLSRAVDLDTVTTDRVQVLGPDGTPHPIDLRMYYGNGSNILNLWPTDDWADDTVYTVSIGPGITSFDGQTIDAAQTFTFSTGPAPEPPSCGCASTGGGLFAAPLLLGLALIRRRR